MSHLSSVVCCSPRLVALFRFPAVFALVFVVQSAAPAFLFIIACVYPPVHPSFARFRLSVILYWSALFVVLALYLSCRPLLDRARSFARSFLSFCCLLSRPSVCLFIFSA
ncbi:hypothetical protein HDK90DRAFT_297322 [Phyllosticta capitalensis]|uniref:Transmembrane protein n=1 Tax=Phyllosticta capitalensis TaxID=121624 RepID=A0ABR1YJW0_9PEZI